MYFAVGLKLALPLRPFEQLRRSFRGGQESRRLVLEEHKNPLTPSS